MIRTDINRPCLDFPNVIDLNLEVVTPKCVHFCISEAINLSWTPNKKGPQLNFVLISKNQMNLIN